MYIPSADPAALCESIAAASPVARGPADEALDSAWAVFVAERSRAVVPQLVTELTAAAVPFFGGVFPALLGGAEVHDEGLVAVRLPAAVPPLLVPGLALDTAALPNHGACSPTDTAGGCTVIVLVDGLSDRIGPFLRALFHHFGNEVTYLGGGAGALDLSRQPCLFTADGFVADAAVLAFVPRRGSVAVRHGWAPIMGPFVATRTRRNVIEELNWRPAFPVYREVVSADAGQPVDEASFLDVAKGYPFGIERAGEECVVRDPLTFDERGGLVCVGDVPENAVLHILKGEPAALVAAAGEASRAAVSRCPPAHTGCGLVFDCISRALFLREAFDDERRAVTGPIAGERPGVGLVGALSLGEIASYGRSILEFLNKTVVVGLIDEGA